MIRNRLDPNSYVLLRQILPSNAPIFWEALDRSVEHPKLIQRQGPIVGIAELSRKDDYYQADRVRWLVAKASGQIFSVTQPPQPAPDGTTPSGAAPTTTPPSTTTPAPAAAPAIPATPAPAATPAK